jgi:peptide/nickel transport system ATP-binding protein
MADRDMIEVKGLRVVAGAAPGPVTEIVKGVDFSVKKGEVLALIGESGSGKTTIALSLLGYARAGCAISGGSVRIGELEVLSLDAKGRRALRARTVAYVAQSASAGFNPARTIMDQVTEPALLHHLMTKEAARAKAIGLFRSLALPAPETIGERYPHQVSGGQLQRLMAAMALITDPAVVVFDEPTTALDVTTQIEVLAAFKKVIRELGTTAVYVSHDLAVVAQMADRIVVLNGGAVKENGAVAQVLDAPVDAYTRQLLAATRRPEAVLTLPPNLGKHVPPLLEIRGLSAGYGRIDRHGAPAVRVLDDVSLSIPRGSTLGVIGESGSGKTTLARVVAGLVDRARGEVLFNGEPLPAQISRRTRGPAPADAVRVSERRHRAQPEPFDRRYSRPPAQRSISIMRGSAAKQAHAGTAGPREAAGQRRVAHAGELSGGQKQRINLARALAAEPDLDPVR